MPRKLPVVVGAVWTVSTRNQKTGVIPTQYVGRTRAETWASCEGCSLRPDAGGGCYAWGGNSVRGANSVQKAAANGKPATLAEVLDRTPRSSKCVRFGAIGDPARVKVETLLADIDLARREGFKVLGYTHHWKGQPRTGVLRNTFLASCETLEQVSEARSRGWLVALAGPVSVPGMVTCPHYKRPEIQCNRCGLCDVPTLRRTGYTGVVFPAHGISRKRLPLAGQ